MVILVNCTWNVFIDENVFSKATVLSGLTFHSLLQFELYRASLLSYIIFAIMNQFIQFSMFKRQSEIVLKLLFIKVLSLLVMNNFGYIGFNERTFFKVILLTVFHQKFSLNNQLKAFLIIDTVLKKKEQYIVNDCMNLEL